jgi:hypothetical protein
MEESKFLQNSCSIYINDINMRPGSQRDVRRITKCD